MEKPQRLCFFYLSLIAFAFGVLWHPPRSAASDLIGEVVAPSSGSSTRAPAEEADKPLALFGVYVDCALDRWLTERVEVRLRLLGASADSVAARRRPHTTTCLGAECERYLPEDRADKRGFLLGVTVLSTNGKQPEQLARLWLTDRSSGDGRYADLLCRGCDLAAMLEERVTSLVDQLQDGLALAALGSPADAAKEAPIRSTVRRPASQLALALYGDAALSVSRKAQLEARLLSWLKKSGQRVAPVPVLETQSAFERSPRSWLSPELRGLPLLDIKVSKPDDGGLELRLRLSTNASVYGTAVSCPAATCLSTPDGLASLLLTHAGKLLDETAEVVQPQQQEDELSIFDLRLSPGVPFPDKQCGTQRASSPEKPVQTSARLAASPLTGGAEKSVSTSSWSTQKQRTLGATLLVVGGGGLAASIGLLAVADKSVGYGGACRTGFRGDPCAALQTTGAGGAILGVSLALVGTGVALLATRPWTRGKQP